MLPPSPLCIFMTVFMTVQGSKGVPSCIIKVPCILYFICKCLGLLWAWGLHRAWQVQAKPQAQQRLFTPHMQQAQNPHTTHTTGSTPTPPAWAAIKARAMSIPAATPELVQYLPDTTQRAVYCHRTRPPPWVTTHGHARLLLVAWWSSRHPAAAKRADPVHTERHTSACRARVARSDMAVVSVMRVRVPMPPGMSSQCMGM